MLQISMVAYAQNGDSDPLRADVNGDGKVDLADVTELVNIILSNSTAPAATYYWYAGQTQPESINGTPIVDDENFTNNKWHTLNANQINQTITGGTAGNSWYIAVPTAKSFNAYASDMATPNNTWNKLSTITINSISYDVWRPNSTGAKMNVYMK